MPVVAPDAKRQPMAETLVRTKLDLLFGESELSVTDGPLSFRNAGQPSGLNAAGTTSI